MLSDKSLTDCALQLIMSLAVNWPVLLSWGLELPKLMLIIVEQGQGKTLARFLTGKHTGRIDSFNRETDLKKVFLETNSAAVIYRYRQSANDNEFLENLIGIGESGCYSGEPVRAMLIVISEGCPLGVNREGAFTICLDEDLKNIKPVSLNKVIPKDSMLSVLKMLTKGWKDSEGDRDLAAFISAAWFCYPQMTEEERKTLFPDLLKTAGQLVDKNEELSEPEDICDLVVGEILRWREDTDFSKAYELPYLDKEACDCLEMSVLFNDEYVYMSECLFKNAVERLLRVYPIMKVLESLRINDFIRCDSVKTATSRVGFYGPDGNYGRVRMLRFNRKRLGRLGEQPFVEQCLSAREGDGYEP